MKNILFATTALVATAGIASAQDLGVALTGGAEMGIFSVESLAPNGRGGIDTVGGDAQFFTDFELRITFSGEADNGLSFGATIDLDEANANGVHENPSLQGGEAIFVSFGGATLTMGDTDGAYDARLAEMALAGGSLNDDETTHIGFDSQGGGASNSGEDGNGGGQIARFDYTYNSFTGSFSMEQGDEFGDTGNNVPENIYGIGLSYNATLSGIDLGIGFGFQSQEDVSESIGLSITGAMSNGFSAGLLLTQQDFDFRGSETQSHVGVGIGYSMNAIAVGLNYGKFDNKNGIDGNELSGVGLAASYDLGGGLAAQFGYGHNDNNGDTFNTYSAGLSMSF